jgi:hypothetical protein
MAMPAPRVRKRLDGKDAPTDKTPRRRGSLAIVWAAVVVAALGFAL